MQEEEHVEEESILTEYDPDEFFSGAVNTLDSTLPLDLFEFEYPLQNLKMNVSKTRIRHIEKILKQESLRS